MAKKGSKIKKASDPNSALIAHNKKARHDYTILDTYEAGLSLQGTEVKALREGKASLADGYAQFSNDELWLENVHIPEYSNGSWTNHSTRRRRKLLLHRGELDKIQRRLEAKGLTVVPLKLYFKDGRAKVEVAVAQGKRDYDKRHALRERQDNLEAQRQLSNKNKYNQR